MSDPFDRVHEKLDKIVCEIGEIRVLDAVQNQQLKEHIRRSDLLEQRVEQVDKQLKPIQDHVTVIRGLFKIAGGVGFILGLLETLRRLL